MIFQRFSYSCPILTLVRPAPASNSRCFVRFTLQPIRLCCFYELVEITFNYTFSWNDMGLICAHIYEGIIIFYGNPLNPKPLVFTFINVCLLKYPFFAYLNHMLANGSFRVLFFI